MHYQGGTSFYSNSTLVPFVLSILSLCTKEIQTLVSYLRLFTFVQRAILCFKEVIFSREHDYACLSVEPHELILEKFMEDPWRGIL